MGLGEFPQHMKSWSLGLGVGGVCGSEAQAGLALCSPMESALELHTFERLQSASQEK